MKSGRVRSLSAGFTIVEVLIFLAVSSVLLVSAFATISNTQNHVYFSQAMNEAQQQLSKISNNVANGYSGANGLTCGVDSLSGNIVWGGAGAQCEYVGKLLEFKKDSSDLKIYSVGGVRLDDDGNDVKKYEDSKATIIPGEQNFTFKNGIKIKWIRCKSGCAGGAIGFFMDFGNGRVPGSDSTSASMQNDFAIVPDDNIDIDSDASAISTANFKSNYVNNRNPAGGIDICFNSGTTNQHGVITIGGSGTSTDEEVKISGGDCPA